MSKDWCKYVCKVDYEKELTALRAQVSALQTERDEAKRRCAIAENVLKNGAEGLWELADYRADNLSLNEGLRESAAARRKLEAKLAEAERQVQHWEDQHANEVKRARILKDTTDLPLERVRAYELMGELQGQVERLTADVARKEGLRKLSSEAHYQIETERDQLRAEVERLAVENAQQRTILEDAFKSGRITVEVADLSTSYDKGAESMRERAAEVAEATKFTVAKDATDKLHNYTCGKVAGAIRALPLEENEG